MPKALTMVHEADPKQLLWDRAQKFLSHWKAVCGARVLIAVYMRPEKTVSGIILTQKYRDEDRWQGKVGLVLKMGSRAFVDDENHHWEDNERPKVGDWIVFNIGDSRSLDVKDNPCRFIEDTSVQGIIDDPDLVY